MNKVIIGLVALLTLACSVSTAATTAGKSPSTATAIVPTVTAQPVNTPQNAHSAIVARSGGLNVRICAGTDCASLCVILDNSLVTLIGTPSTVNGSKWQRVKTTAGITGWVNSKYLEIAANRRMK